MKYRLSNKHYWGHRIKSMAKQYRKREIINHILKNLQEDFGLNDISKANYTQIYKACAKYVQSELYELMVQTEKKQKLERKVHFICMEILLGRSLKNNAYNLGMLDALQDACEDLEVDINKIFIAERDAGLGSDSIGRLSACYGDAAATIGVAGTGYTIRYEEGNFIQKIQNGEQIELPDLWLETGEVWQSKKESEAKIVKFGGEVHEIWQNDALEIAYKNAFEVLAIPYDMVISGYYTEHTVKLRLWKAKSLSKDNLDNIKSAEAISKKLYNDDITENQKEEKLKQQYFLVSATIQDICKKHKDIYGTLENFAEKNVIHLMDTRSALSIPELMRILLDEEKMSWEFAWNITTQSIAYTNHSMRQNSLEFCSARTMEKCIPRIMSIINEINRRYTSMLMAYYPDDISKINRMSVISDSRINMANLGVIGSFSVNGVSTLHGELLKNHVFSDLYSIYPAKFRQITNGISVRRWLCQANPELTDLISSKIGTGFITHPSELHVLAGLGSDKTLLENIGKVKLNNKKRLAEYILEKTGIKVNVNTMFDVHCKNVYMHKRHLMYLMHVLTIYNKIKKKEEKLLVPRTFIMCARAMTSNKIEKKIIKLTHAIANMINNDIEVNNVIKFVFLENYNVSLSEIVVPAADLSEQLSLTGSEASGTGNMKLMMNGAVTIGTWDGANIEIEKTVGRENILLFGTQPSEAFTGRVRPEDYNHMCPELEYAIERIEQGFGDGENYKDVLDAAFKANNEIDYYRIGHDFASYCRTQERASQMYLRPQNWNYMALINIANSGRFAADRSVAEYAQNIWRVPSKFSF